MHLGTSIWVTSDFDLEHANANAILESFGALSSKLDHDSKTAYRWVKRMKLVTGVILGVWVGDMHMSTQFYFSASAGGGGDTC